MLPDPYCFEGLGPDGQMLALFQAIVDNGGGGGVYAGYYYASSSDGSDSNTGFDEDNALATFNAAMAAAEAQTEPVLGIRLKGGDTFYEEVTWPASLSGMEGSPIEINSYGTGKATLSGGYLIQSAWTLVDATKNIWSTPYNAGSTHPRGVWVNGYRCWRSRRVLTPNFSLTGEGLQITPGGAQTGNEYDSLTTNRLTQEFVFRMEWQEQRLTRLNFDQPAENVWLAAVAFDRLDLLYAGNLNNLTSSGHAIENIQEHFEEDASTASFFHDPSSHTFYLIPPLGVSPSSAEIIVSRREQVLVMDGASDVEISNVRFSHTTNERVYNESGYIEIQAGVCWGNQTNIYTDEIDPTVGVSLDSCTRVSFLRNEFVRMGAWAVQVKGESLNCSLIGNYCHDLSGGAFITGSAAINTTGPTGTIIQNNLIRNWGVEYHGACGITHFYGDDTLIEHNDMAFGPYTGISYGYGWDEPEAASNFNSGGRVRLNLIRGVVQEMLDGAGIYTNSVMQDTVVSGNYIYDVGIAGGAGQPGLYADEGTPAGCSITGNVVHSILGGIQLKANASTATWGTNTVLLGGGTAAQGTVNAVDLATATAEGEALNAGLEAGFSDLLTEFPDTENQDDWTNGLIGEFVADDSSSSLVSVNVSHAVNRRNNGWPDLKQFTEASQPLFVPNHLNGHAVWRCVNDLFSGQAVNKSFQCVLMAVVRLTDAVDGAFQVIHGNSSFNGVGMLSFGGKRQGLAGSVAFAEDGDLTTSQEIWTFQSAPGGAWNFRVNGLSVASGNFGGGNQAFGPFLLGSGATQCEIAEQRIYLSGLDIWAILRAEQALGSLYGIAVP